MDKVKRDIYMPLCMVGRKNEATAYWQKCEAQRTEETDHGEE